MGILASERRGVAMMRRTAMCLAAVGLISALIVGPATSASADVVTPAGACFGSGTWTGAGMTETSAEHAASDVIHIPQKDSVVWAGNIKGYAPGATGPRRPIAGQVDLKLPIGKVTIDDWGGSSVRYANTGVHKYDLPSFLIGLKLTLSGVHKDAGKTTCAGSVKLIVDGTNGASNPLKLIGAVGMLIALLPLVLAGRPVASKVWAFEDENPG